MKIFTTKRELQAYLEDKRTQHTVVALVPTMGALHEGHLSLIQEAKKNAKIVVCSIFVNPTQFNDPKDLEKYPRPLEEDIALLEEEECDILFLPSVTEMYPDEAEKWHIDLGDLDKIWEGKHRAGHFQGVTQIVHKLFALVLPDVACFGQKDFQQVMVIQKMIDSKALPVKLIICPTVRSLDGLALSSRNIRLSPVGKQIALTLSQTLFAVKQHFGSHNPSELTQMATDLINGVPDIELEYFAICETRTLHTAVSFQQEKKYVALVVAWVEGVRLIDNILLND